MIVSTGPSSCAPWRRASFPGALRSRPRWVPNSAVLLALVADVDPTIPVLFLETGMLFPETLAYARTLTAHLGLRDVRWLVPEPGLVAHHDPDRDLWIGDPDRCCYLRKVRPFKTALHGFDCWISGVKRAHGGARGDVRPIELEEGRIKLNPLALWTAEAIERAFADLDLPRHPLVERGYRSIGCIPCTRAVRPDEDARAGRWAARAKTECGIHDALHARTKSG